jgi:hypothetical protein
MICRAELWFSRGSIIMIEGNAQFPRTKTGWCPFESARWAVGEEVGVDLMVN